jgi:dihydrodipicolinate synthase/N-acetylneuraminate lyase
MFYPKGVYPAMLMPFDQDGLVNEPELRKYVDFLIDGGLHGLFPISSVGEGIHMGMADKERAMRIVVDQAAGRVPVTPGVSSANPRDAIALAKVAEELGCPAVVAAPPYYYKISNEVMEKYFEAIADSVDIGLILYNIPLFTQPIDYDVVKRLSRRDNVVGMKDSSGSMVDFMHFMDKAKIAEAKINFMTGREEGLYAVLAMGAAGCMTGTSAIVPELMVAIYDNFMAGNLERSLELQRIVPNMVRTMFAVQFPIGFKAALEMRGFDMGPPWQPLSDAEIYRYNTVKSRIRMIMGPVLELAEKLKKEKAAA